MRAIFHIGHHKTGTTSLQSFLTVNWARLVKAGILSPWVESQAAAWLQAQMLSGEDQAPELLPANVREPHNALAFRMLNGVDPSRPVPKHHANVPAPRQMFAAIDNQIDMLHPETLVFVSEVMSHFGPDAPELIDQLAGALSGADFGLHVTLRRPDDHLVAWHGQQLWFGTPAAALSDPQSESPFNGVHFDYRSMVEPWRDRLPGAVMRIRSHREAIAAGGSIADFFAQSGIALPEGLRDVPVMNPSLPRAFFPLMQKANTALRRRAARSLGPDLAAIAGQLDLPAPGDIEFFGPARRDEMAARFAPIHDWLSEQIGQPLFDDIDTLTTPRPVSDVEALEQVLAALTDDHIAGFTNPEVRAFVTDLKAG